MTTVYSPIWWLSGEKAISRCSGEQWRFLPPNNGDFSSKIPIWCQIAHAMSIDQSQKFSSQSMTFLDWKMCVIFWTQTPTTMKRFGEITALMSSRRRRSSFSSSDFFVLTKWTTTIVLRGKHKIAIMCRRIVFFVTYSFLRHFLPSPLDDNNY